MPTPDRVRVLRVIARLNAGGPAHQVGILSSRLAARGYETLLVHGRVPRGEVMMPQFDERYPSRRAELPVLGRDPRPLDDATALWHLVRVVREFRPDIVHTHTAKAGLLGRLASQLVCPRPLVVHTFHGHVFEGYFRPVVANAYRLTERALARISDCLIGVSQATASDIVRLHVAPARKVRVVPLGLDLDRFLASSRRDGEGVRAELDVGDGEVVAVTVGRLVPIKRLDRAVEAVAAAGRSAPIRLAIVGDGPCRPALEAQARALGVGHRVSFMGYRGDLVEIMAAADMVLLTSDNEGTPVSLIEGAAAGKPAVATDVGGVREVVTPESGVVVPAGDALARELSRLARDDDLRRRLGAAAREDIKRRFGAERLVDDIDRLYRELLGAPGRRRPDAHQATLALR